MKIRFRGLLPKPGVAEGSFDPSDFTTAAAGADRKTFIGLLRQALTNADARLAERFHQNHNVDQLVKARAWAVDQLILAAWNYSLAEHDDIALVAVGGFGRGELHPHSDVDLLVLLGSSPPGQERRKTIEEFVMLLWDAGFYLGHSVRSVETCVSEARKEISTATSLMESRLISGDRQLFAAMLEATGADKVWSPGEFFDAKYKEQLSRHEQYHATAYNLEPNIKEGPGGLRDIQMIGWVAKRHFSTQSLHTLVTRGFLTESELQELKDGRTFLWAIRFALHLLAGRGEDRLLFDYQRQIAGHFSASENGENGNAVVEHFMQRYYRTVMQLERLNERLLQLFSEELLSPGPDLTEDLGEHFRVTHGFIEAANENLFSHRPIALLELFVLLAKHRQLLGVRASTVRLICDNLHLIDDGFRNDPGAHACFFELLSQPGGVYTQLQRMNRYGVLAAFIPAFGHIVGRMQFDLFHVYTVDQHILFVVRNLRRFAYGKYRKDFSHAGDIFQQIDHPEILYLAALFHDIAKGRKGDHSILGAADARVFCQHLPLRADHAERVAWLVENHLLMSLTAQRRDITDPDTIVDFCRVVSDQVRLDYLYLMTIADIAATSPKLWNSWKDSLLWELYSVASAALEDGSSNLPDRARRINETREHVAHRLEREGLQTSDIEDFWKGLPQNVFLRLSPDQLAWATGVVLRAPDRRSALVALRNVSEKGCSELLVHTQDYDGLFSAVTTVIDEIGLNVLSARVMTSDDGRSFDLFQLMDRHDQAVNDIDTTRLEARLLDVLERARVPVPVVRRLPRRLRPFKRSARIRFSAAHAGELTLMEVDCSDRPGLLSQIAATLLATGIRIHDARITTLGDRVEDTFVISDEHNAPLTRRIRTELKRQLSEKLGTPGVSE